MLDFQRVSKSDPLAATVHIVAVDGVAMGQITWPASDGSSSLIPKSVGRYMPAAVAVEMAKQALELQTVERVVIQIEDDKLWDQSWGRISWGDAP